jgi:putative nucleotidyltransferase with HDIG domain
MQDERLTSEQRAIRIQNFIDRMPSLSTTVTKVLQICNQPQTSAKDLNQVISLDPVLTGRVLKLINSAYYSLPNKITSLTRAIIMLGLNTVKNLALSTAVVGTVGKEASFQSISMDQFWTHSICVGVTAKALAAKKGVAVQMREECFVAGMLHDLGKIVLSGCFPEQFALACNRVREGQDSLVRVEAEIFGFDHSSVGRMIAEKWQFNDVMINALGYHHEPYLAKDTDRELVAIVSVANMYANIFDFGSAGDPYQDYDILVRTLELLGLQWDDLALLQDTVEDEIEKARIFLQVAEVGD